MSKCVLSRDFNQGDPSQRLLRCTSSAGTSERSELAASATLPLVICVSPPDAWLLERVNRTLCMNGSEKLKRTHSAWTIKSRW